jgi:hypothetical protein
MSFWEFCVWPGQVQHFMCLTELLTATTILGAFAELRKATISFVMSVLPSVHVEQLDSYWTDFHEIRYLNVFRKNRRDISRIIKIGQE